MLPLTPASSPDPVLLPSPKPCQPGSLPCPGLEPGGHLLQAQHTLLLEWALPCLSSLNLAYLFLSLPHHNARVHAGPASSSHHSCGTLADHQWLCPHPHSRLGALLLPFWWGGPLCFATHPVLWAVSLLKLGLPGCLKGLTTQLGVMIKTRKSMKRIWPPLVLSTGREGVGGTEATLPLLPTLLALPRSHTPIRHFSPFRLLLEQGLHWHWGWF